MNNTNKKIHLSRLQIFYFIHSQYRISIEPKYGLLDVFHRWFYNPS